MRMIGSGFEALLYSTYIKRTLAVVCLLSGGMVFPQWSQVFATTRGVSALIETDNFILAAAHDRILRSSDNGANWDSIAVLSSFAASDFATLDGNIFVVTSWLCAGFCDPQECLFLSPDNGANWQAKFSAPYGADFIEAHGNYLFLNAGTGLYRSADAGNQWARIDSGMNVSGGLGNLVSSDGILYGTQKGRLYQTDDNGESWTSLSEGLPDDYIYALAVRDSIIFIGTSQFGVYRSTNSGQGWTSVSTGLPENALISDFASHGGYLFTTIISVTAGGYYTGVYLTEDNGLSWEDVNHGLLIDDITLITELLIRSDYIFAAGTGGIWRRPLSELLSVAETPGGDLPSAFRLNQNYPNPFNSQTIITYVLPEEVPVSLEVYSLTGRLIENLVQQRQGPGTYQIVYSAGHLPSGVYLYRLKAIPIGDGERFIAGRKMLLLR